VGDFARKEGIELGTSGIGKSETAMKDDDKDPK